MTDTLLIRFPMGPDPQLNSRLQAALRKFPTLIQLEGCGFGGGIRDLEYWFQRPIDTADPELREMLFILTGLGFKNDPSSELHFCISDD